MLFSINGQNYNPIIREKNKHYIFVIKEKIKFIL